MIKVEFYDLNEEHKLKYVVLQSRYGDEWVFVRHRERITWEVPGGRIEPNEMPDDAARRELVEETGALDFTIEPVFDYSVERASDVSYGRVYLCDIKCFGELGDFEIAEVIFSKTMPTDLTYTEIQPLLFEKLKELKELEV